MAEAAPGEQAAEAVLVEQVVKEATGAGAATAAKEATEAMAAQGVTADSLARVARAVPVAQPDPGVNPGNQASRDNPDNQAVQVSTTSGFSRDSHRLPHKRVQPPLTRRRMLRRRPHALR